MYAKECFKYVGCSRSRGTLSCLSSTPLTMKDCRKRPSAGSTLSGVVNDQFETSSTKVFCHSVTFVKKVIHVFILDFLFLHNETTRYMLSFFCTHVFRELETDKGLSHTNVSIKLTQVSFFFCISSFKKY